MSKIVRLFNKQEQDQQALVKHIEDLLDAAKNGEIKNVMIAAENDDGDIITGYCNLGVGEKQYMIGRIQSDVMFQIVSANVDRLIEIVEE